MHLPGIGGLTLRGRRVLPLHHLPDRLPVQAPQGLVHDQDLPPEHQRERVNLLGHLEGSVESGIDHFERCVCYLNRLFFCG